MCYLIYDSAIAVLVAAVPCSLEVASSSYDSLNSSHTIVIVVLCAQLLTAQSKCCYHLLSTLFIAVTHKYNIIVVL
jgi:hypothetical protein